MGRRRRFSRAAPALVAATLACACMEEPRPPLQIAMSASPSAEVLELARERGLFAAEGANVRLVEHTSDGDVLRAFERGQADGMLATLVEVLHERDDSHPDAHVVMVTDAAGADGTIFARAPIAGLRDKPGLRVAAEPRSASLYVLLETLEKNDLTISDVTIVRADPIAMPRLLADGTVDAVSTYPPWTQQIARASAGRTLNPGARAADAVEVLAFDDEALERRADDVAAVLRAWDRALDLLRSDRARSLRTMASRERLTVREFEPLLDRARLLRSGEQQRWLASGGDLQRAAERAARRLRQNGQLTGPDRADPVARPLATPGGAG